MKFSYKIEVEVNPVENILRGVEEVKISNISKDLRDLTILYQLPYIGKGERLTIELEGEKLSFKCVEGERDTHEKRFLVNLNKHFTPSNEVNLTIKFKGFLPYPRYGRLIYLADSWYPKIVFEEPYAGRYEIKLKVPKGYQIVTSGLEVSVEDRDGFREYSLEADKIFEFGMVIGKELRFVEDVAKGVIVRSHYYPKEEKWGRILLENACDVIEYYCEEFGFYPHKVLNVIPGSKRFTGGFPFATNIVAIHDLSKLGDKALEFSKWITAHEIGHMYWGHYVLGELDWLKIGLGIYMDRHYSESRGLNLGRYKRGVKGSFIERYLDGLRRGFDTTIMQPFEKLYRAGFDWNNVIVHGKGYAIIAMLELLLGKETFRKIHDEGLKRYAYKGMSVEDFKKLCEEISGENLEWFFYQWLYTNRFLSYKVEWEDTKVDNTYKVEVKVIRLGNAIMPIPVVAYLENGEKIVKWIDRRLRVNILGFKSEHPIVKVELDPDKILPILKPEEIPEQLIVNEIYLNFNNCTVLSDIYEIVEKREIKDFSAWFRLGLCLYDVEKYDEAVRSFKKTIELIGDRKSPLLAWSYIWIGHILDILGKREEAVKMYQKAIEIGKGAVMQFAQYNIGPIDAITWAKERLKTPFKRRESLAY